MTKRICLWSSPRNISTALMYSFSQRSDTIVFDEPLYAHYLRSSGKEHPGRTSILSSQDNNGDRVVKDILLKNHAPVNFYKLMAHFLINIDKTFLKKMTNIIFIRDPVDIINSYSKIIPNPTIENIGVKMQYDLYKELKKNKREPIILDARELLKNPEIILRQLCEIIGIDFDVKMLKWERGPKKEDGCWSKYWYKNVHQSTGFLPYTEKIINLTRQNSDLAKQCNVYYQFLYKRSIKP